MLLEIAVTLLMAKLLSYIFERFKQPGIVGEILAGIILGPCLIGSLSGKSINIFGSTLFQLNLNLNTPEFKELAFIGTIFLLFIIGLETDTSDLKKTGKAGFLTAICGLIIPFIFGFIIGSLFGLNAIQCMVIGLIFSASSITVSMRMLSDLGLSTSRVGLTLQTAGVVSDIVGLLIFSLVMGVDSPLINFLRISIFFLLIVVIGSFFIKYAIKKGISRNTTMKALPIGLIICFSFAAFAQDLGLASIVGAFMAGLIIKKTPQGGIISSYIKIIGQTFFIPLFFVSIGASFYFIGFFSGGNIYSQILFITIFIILGLSGNFIGGAIGAKLGGLTKKESILAGIGVTPIMTMSLIIISTATQRGVFNSTEFAQLVNTATLLLIIIGSMVIPTILKRSMNTTFVTSRTDLKNIMYSLKERMPEREIIRKSHDIHFKNKRLITSLFVFSVFLQILLLIQLKSYDLVYALIALGSGIVGAYLAYLTIKYILIKQKSFLKKEFTI